MSQPSRRFSLIFVGWIFSVSSAGSSEIPPAFVPRATEPAAVKSQLLFEASALESLVDLEAAPLALTNEIAALSARNAGGRLPWQTGIVRPLERPLRVAIAATSLSEPAGLVARGLLVPDDGGYLWVGRFTVAESHRVRLLLNSVDLPADAQMLVFNLSGEAVAFGLELRDPNGELWTPSIAGPTIFLEVRASRPARAHSFEIAAVAERFVLDQQGRVVANDPQQGVDTGCIVDSACVDSATLSGVASYRAGVAHIVFSKNGGEFICSASLLNDQDQSGFIPYALTANHCFSSQSSASSLEGFWDYHASSCGGSAPDLGSLPRSNGSTLLATSAETDFSFVRLNSAPAGNNGRTYLGWTTTPPADGSLVHSLHHPLGEQQAYTRSRVDRSPSSTCSGLPLDDFIYSSVESGATFGGSSGSSITDGNLRVVGQLLGACGPNPDEPCSAGPNDYEVNGAFAVTKPSLSTWLDAMTPPPPPPMPCVDGPTTLCLLNKRFKIEATFRTNSGQTGAAKAVRLTEETGYFWFFTQTNIEVVFKLLNGCGLNSRYWVFAGGLTDVEVTTTITDTNTGATKPYFNTLDRPFQPITDTQAFATCP